MTRSGQTDLFTYVERKAAQAKPLVNKAEFGINEEGKRPLTGWAFLLTAGKSGFTGYHFMMTTEDRRAWCASDMSQGSLYGSPWAYFFNTVETYAFHPWDGHAERGKKGQAVLDIRKMRDNGKYDKKIASLGLRKYGKTEIKEILGEYGIEVKI